VRHVYSLCVRSLRLAAQLLVVRIALALLRLCRASRRVVPPLDFSSVASTGSRSASGHYFSRRDYSSSGLHRLYCAYAVHPDAAPRRSTSRHSVALALTVCPVISLCVVTTRLAAATNILRLRRASGCLGTSRGSSSTTSTMPRVRVPWHVVRLVTQLVAPLVVDFFAEAARPGASARRAARRAARRRLLRLRRAFGCLGTSRGSSCGSSSTTSPTPHVRVPRHVVRLVMRLIVDYIDYAARPCVSACRAAHHAARRRILHLRRAPGCLGTSRGSSSTTSPTSRARVPRHVTQLVVDHFDTSRGSSRGSSCRSSSTSSPMPRVRVPRHVARHVARLVVDYFTYTARPGASARRAARR
jgi:hypothetical protein